MARSTALLWCTAFARAFEGTGLIGTEKWSADTE